MTLPWLSVVVPSLGDQAKLVPLLDALTRQSLPRERFEVLVVLDGAGASSALAARARALDVELIRLERRAGPGAARNRGALEARGEFLAFTEDDVAPAPDWLERAAARLEAEPSIDVLEGATIEPGGRPIRRPAGDHPLYLPTNLFVRRALFERLGGYCEDFFDSGSGAYFREDSDLGFRLEEARARIARETSAIVTHPREHPRFLDPLRWARRYEMDPLLESRHPRLFRERIEAHRWGPFLVRRPMVRASLACVTAAVLAALAGAAGSARTAAALLGVGGAALVFIWAKWRFDPLRLPLLPLVPVVLIVALLRGGRRLGRVRAGSGAVHRR